MVELQTEFGKDVDPELVQEVRELLATRQDLLDELIRKGGQYSNQLIEYRAASSSFLDQVLTVERFLFSQVLWSRSVPKPIIPRLSDIGEALGWLSSTRHLRDVSVVGVEIGGEGILGAIFLALVVALRQPIRRRLGEVAKRVSDPETDSLKSTVQAMALTTLLAAPLPTAFYISSKLVERIGDSTYWFASATALSELTMVAALFELIRQIFAPKGLAEAHFSWPTYATQPLHRGLLATEAIGLPSLYVSLHLAFAGMRLDSPDNLQLYNNSLGRMAFIAALLVFGLSILAMLRPEEKTEPTDQDMRLPWPRRFAKYAFPIAFLGAYPIITIATIVPAVLAAFGFYVTGVLLAYQMLRTLLLALVLMVGGALIHRWRIVNRKRELLELSEEAENETRQEEIETTEKQIRHLFRFAAIIILAVGLWTVWSDALPMLQMLKRVQILPRLEMLEPVEDTSKILGLGTTTAASAAEAGVEPGVDAPPPGFPVAATGPDGAATVAATQTASSPLTLWLLLEAVLAGLITLVMVRNFPSVIEILLRRRTTLDGGARFAVSTLVRYSITIIGTIIVFGLLGITWNKVQWLAAALTFGLGFGLQEIVANFVSGLILLIERPVRVGDVVTIGTLMGKVNRIQIRATTITLWDRSEMIVPNKEFITTKLVNWTLSDSKRRIDIPVRIAYGADLEQVKQILVDAANDHPSVLEDPEPHALLLGFGADAINLELRFVVDFGHGLATKDEVQMKIQSVFKEHGIEFALPKSEVKWVSNPETNPGSALERD